MPVDPKSANHICNVIRRRFREECPELTFLFLVHGEGKRRKAIMKASAQLGESPAGAQLLAGLEDKNIAQADRNRSTFIGLSEHHTSGFLNFFRTHEVIALFYVNHERFETDEDLYNHAYHMAWHALALYEDYKDWKNARDDHDEDAAEIRNFVIANGVVLPELDTQALYHRNLSADIFSASMQTLLGKDDAIKTLARQRMRGTLIPQRGFVAEKFPFPVSIETMDFLFSESIKNLNKNSRAIPTAIKLTKEIGMTCTAQTIKQWISFARPAQEMAWAGYAPETILGAALYSCENTYVRSIADLVAENMDFKPDLVTTLDGYNPFTDQEANQRLHERKCKETWQKNMLSVRGPEDSKIFYENIKKQNRELMEGRPVGWCAYALMQAANVIETAAPQDLNQAITRAQKTFERESGAVSWENLCRLTRTIFAYRRDGYDITPERLAHICEKSDLYAPVKRTLQEPVQEKPVARAKKTVLEAR